MAMLTGINAQPHGLSELKLTGEQKEVLSSLRLEHYKEMKPLRAQMGELKARENTLMSQEQIDVKSLNKLIDEKTGLMNKMQKLKLNHQLAFREILSDEQEMILDQKRTLARRGEGPKGRTPKGAGMHHGGHQRASQL